METLIIWPWNWEKGFTKGGEIFELRKQPEKVLNWMVDILAKGNWLYKPIKLRILHLENSQVPVFLSFCKQMHKAQVGLKIQCFA